MIIFADTETNFHANGGIDDIVDAQTPFVQAHPQISVGDFIQFAGAVGVSNCPGAPRLSFLLGRKNATRPAQDLTVPEPFDSVDKVEPLVCISSDPGVHDIPRRSWLASPMRALPRPRSSLSLPRTPSLQLTLVSTCSSHPNIQLANPLCATSRPNHSRLVPIGAITAHPKLIYVSTGTPFDSTPFTFDTQFFVETQVRGTLFPGMQSIHDRCSSS